MATRNYAGGQSLKSNRRHTYYQQDGKNFVEIQNGDTIILMDQTGDMCNQDTRKRTWRFIRRGTIGIIHADYLDAYFQPNE